MIRLKISNEAFTDIFTPGVLSPHKCTKGLPIGVKLTGVTFDSLTDTVVCLFDDGNTDLKETTITFSGVREIK